MRVLLQNNDGGGNVENECGVAESGDGSGVENEGEDNDSNG